MKYWNWAVLIAFWCAIFFAVIVGFWYAGVGGALLGIACIWAVVLCLEEHWPLVWLVAMLIGAAWFNEHRDKQAGALTPLVRAGISHLHFECIHPYEDGNGRIGRAISEKSLSQSQGKTNLACFVTHD